MKEQPGSSAVVQGVASNRYAIGYSGVGYKTADVRRHGWPSKADSLFRSRGGERLQWRLSFSPVSLYLLE